MAIILSNRCTINLNRKTAEELAHEVKSQFDTKIDKVREIAEKATAEAKASAEKGEQLSNSLKEKADELLVEVNTLKQQNLEIEQKRLARATAENHQKTIGEQFTSNEEFKKFADHQRSGSSVSLEIKADITTATTGDGAVGSAIMPYRVPGVLELPRRRLTVRDLLMSGVIIVFGVVGLFVYAMVSPDGFIERMKAIAFIPEPLWVIFWTILPVYFGLREVDKTRKAANRTTMLKEIADIEKSRSPKEVVDGNAAQQDWQSEQ